MKRRVAQKAKDIQNRMYDRVGHLRTLARSVRRTRVDDEVGDGCFQLLNGLRTFAEMMDARETAAIVRIVRKRLRAWRASVMSGQIPTGIPV